MKTEIKREFKPTDVLRVTMEISVADIQQALFPEILLDRLCADAMEQFMVYVEELKKCQTTS